MSRRVGNQGRRMHSERRLPVYLSTWAMLTWSVCAGWIDIETPIEKRTTRSLVDGTVYHLVMSDEFNTPNRTFKDGHDPMWTALDKSDDDSSSAGGGSMQFYNSSTVTTENGFLKIRTILQKTQWNYYDHVEKKYIQKQTNFSSGMVQSWNKFCFTGGIIEVDVVFPGTPYIGGLWPAIWMLGNLGRATYEASTNLMWPWSYNKCDRDLQLAQDISACNRENHYGMNPFQGRGATEIDIIEVMAGTSTGYLPSTDPPVEYPYGDFTLQIAPGVIKNRPVPGYLPARQNSFSANGHTEFLAQTWYDELVTGGNTSINPFFYGTYLAETKPEEPVTRLKNQVYQADAIGAAHQLTPAHFEVPHTFRVEWQPGPGGRLDWFVKNYKVEGVNKTSYLEGDGLGDEWVLAYSIKDESLATLMASQIPIEPTYIIFNTAISSTWSFPYDAPGWCPACYDCNDPQCACRFYPGFCPMLDSGDTAMLIDSVRVYQSSNPAAHVGANHTLGCDPPEYPTKGWIKGHEYRYSRNPPFVYEDSGPIRKVKKGGGECVTDIDCGSAIHTVNLTAAYVELVKVKGARVRSRMLQSLLANYSTPGRGKCVFGLREGLLSTFTPGYVCTCSEGFSGPHCLAIDYTDEAPSAYLLNKPSSPFTSIATFQIPDFMLTTIALMLIVLVGFLVSRAAEERKARLPRPATNHILKGNPNVTVVTRTSI